MFLEFSKIPLLLLTEDNKIDERIEHLNKSAPRICTNNRYNKEFTNCKRKFDLCGSKVVTVNVSCSTDDFENQTSSVGSNYLFIDNKIESCETKYYIPNQLKKC